MQSLAKRKRDAEAWYTKDTEMFEGFYIRMDVLRICVYCNHRSNSLFRTDERKLLSKCDSNLIRKQEKNKISSTERVWLLGRAL